MKTLLIANRGEIACRIIRTARARGLATVAVYSAADAAAQHVAMADEAVPIGGAAPADSYLRGERILEAALATGADAIHPGYGFLSENPDFVEAVEGAGLTFVGPPASAIRAMGLKDAAKALMEEAGVAVVPGYHGDAQDGATLAVEAERIGYPVLIKARAGGGGKGMRRVDDPADFAEALAAAQREGEAAFGDPRCLVERYVATPRHIEIQVFGDRHGNVVHLFERDCSLQRRHQKVIEEAPAPGMTEAMRGAMGEAAVRAAKAIGYVGAGTVEFIVDASEGLSPDKFYFMEMNTRLQVEHPVTEMVTGLDLVALQLDVADGAPLPFAQDDLVLTGHAFEARLYAEDPARGFLPATGRLTTLRLPKGEGVRVDTGVVEGDRITPHYDPMIAKLIVHGPDRASALARLAGALAATRIAGCATNAAFLRRLAEHEGFAAGEVDTGLIARDQEALTRPAEASPGAMAVAALAQLSRLGSCAGGPFDALAGFRTWGHARQSARFEGADGSIDLLVTDLGGRRFKVAGPTGDTELAVVGGTDEEVRVLADGRVRTAFVAREPGAVTMFWDGEVHRFVHYSASERAAEAAAGDVVAAPMPGLVRDVRVAPGEAVTKGQALAVLEAMKMEHTLRAPRDGTVAGVSVAAGDQVEDGAVIVALEPAA
ncbi:acetyl/propionyl/methylcrotonyl-CoA carboxylase subunit alpha [Acuticoccus sp.]|uniref:acetyl/propionyl/methylcrotonyl-CoA carboxylase subunit alpha n=1 Tax=Acuticoccus sp. TaxID=1904378 RepID=UPI003B52A6BA